MQKQLISSSTSLPVWDLPTRLYHWLQAALVAAALATGYLAPAWWLGIHVWLGYGIAALVVFRLIWGVFGSEYSRFASFVFSPRQIRAHVEGLLARRPTHAVGHNPLGALMVFAMFAVIATIGICGMVALGGVENQGPLAGLVDFPAGAVARRIHSGLALGLMTMIALHVLGVVAESRLARQSLVRAMITGRKDVPADAGPVRPRPARWRAAAAAAAFAAAGLSALGALAYRVPPSGLIAMPPLAVYGRECGACHEAYHPSLLPRASWTALMAGLDDHFGEDAGLDETARRQIAAYLDSFASEAWDTEAANRLRTVDPTDPTRITAAPFWKRTHRGIGPTVFRTAPVRGTGNCAGCHRDAASGRFDDQMIAPPAPRQSP